MSSTPVIRVIDSLRARNCEPKRSGSGWSARCPAHDDRNPSLSIHVGDDGRALVTCHAGCSAEAIVGSLGMTMLDLFPPREPERTRAKKRASSASSNGSAARTFPTAHDAVRALESKHGPRSATWTYTNAAGEPVGLVVRWDTPTGKSVRPVSLKADAGWTIGGMPEPRPLYALPDLLATKPGDRVYVTEGEKAADAARTVGLTATTSPHGSKSANKADWSPLAGREVVIVPDRDDAGERYAHDLVRLLGALNPRPTVRIVRLCECWPSIPDGGDIADVIRHYRDLCGGDEDEYHRALPGVRESIEALAAAAPIIEPEAVAVDGAPIVRRFIDISAERIDWLWTGRIARGTLTMLVGRPGDGKSFCTTDWASRVSTGRDWPDGAACPRGSVLLVSGEDDPGRVVRPRLSAHGADLSLVHNLDGIRSVGEDGKPREVGFTLADLAALERAIDCIADPALIVIDPIGSFIGGRVDAHRDNEVRAVLHPLAMLAQKRGVAVVLVAHQRKGSASHADDLLLGSRAFTGIARSVLHLLRDPDDDERRLLLPGKANLCRPAPGLAFRIDGDPARLVWEPNPVDLTADGVVAALASGGGGERSERDDAADWLRDYLADGPKPVRELIREAKDAGYSAATVRRARSALGIKPVRVGFGRGGGWALQLPGSIGAQTSIDAPIDAQSPEVERLWEKQAKNVGIHAKALSSEHMSAYGEHERLCSEGSEAEGGAE